MKQTNTAKRTTSNAPTFKSRFENPSEQTTIAKDDFNRKVQETAYKLYAARGYADGYDVEDWLRAEQIVKGA